jgi:hypothetical protein
MLIETLQILSKQLSEEAMKEHNRKFRERSKKGKNCLNNRKKEQGKR